MRTTLIALLCLLALAACVRTSPAPEQVVLYSSVDDALLRPIVGEFERQTGVRVLVVGDNEAVKTTGLVQRLLAETDRPRADVWWSSEPFGTIRLQNQGVLEPYRSDAAERSIEGGWPGHLRGDCWYGFALRFRVVAYAEARTDSAPLSLGELTDPRWRGRVGMARPQFGTTRGHMGVLLERWGPEGLAAWLAAMKDNGLRLYDGNASAVRGIRMGEIDIALTDTDDVWAARRNEWQIGAVYEAPDAPPHPAFPSTGPIAVPNTVALVRGGPNPARARRLIDFLLSEPVERMIAESESHNVPVHPALREPFARWAPPAWDPIDYEAVERRVSEAIAICEDVLE